MTVSLRKETSIEVSVGDERERIDWAYLEQRKIIGHLGPSMGVVAAVKV